MARDRESWYLTFGGLLRGGEIWQSGLHIAATGAGVLDELPTQANVDQMFTRISAFHGNANVAIAENCGLQWARLVHQDVNKVETADAVIHEAASTQWGPVAPSHTPYQVSVVISLRTGSSFGRANYGRCYYPLPTEALSDGRWAAPYTQTVAGEFSDVLEGINTYYAGLAIGEPGFPVLRVVNMSSVGTGQTKAVTRVEVGDVPDTQRRRRNALQETYAGINLNV